MPRREVRSKLLVTKTGYIFCSRVLNSFHSSTALALCHAGVGFAFTNGWHESIFYTWAEGEYSCKAAGGDFYEQTTFHGFVLFTQELLHPFILTKVLDDGSLQHSSGRHKGAG